MKQALKAILVYSVAIALAARWIPGIDYNHQIRTLIIAAIVLGIANTFIRPVLSLILLPINVITLGLVGLLMNALILFIVTLLVANFQIIPFTLNFNGTIIHLTLIWSYLVCSTIISLLISFLRKVVS